MNEEDNDNMKTITVEEAARLVKEGELATSEKRKALQRERLRTLVEYAREHSPYLRELYKDVPDDFELHDLPVLEKSDGLSHYNEWVTDPELNVDLVRSYLKRDPSDNSLLLGRYTALQTSGSTGNPLPMVRDQHRNMIHGQLLQQRLFYGVAPEYFDHSKHKTAFIVHLSTSASSYGTYLRARAQFPGYEDNIIAISILDSAEQMVEKLNAFQPEVIIGYPPSLVMLAEEKVKGNLNISLGLVVSSAELLTEESYHRIHDVFKCPLLNNYCMTEGGEIAMTHDCPHLHINEDWIIIEPVDENRQPVKDNSEFSSGILVTDLANFVQPIIRYYVGDSIRINNEPHECYNLPVMEIRGRIWDSFTLGKKNFTTKGLEVKAKFCEGLCSYQFIKRDENTMELRGIIAAGFEKCEVLKGLSEKIAEYFSEAGCENVTVRYSTEPPIHNDNGGKTPMFLNKATE